MSQQGQLGVDLCVEALIDKEAPGHYARVLRGRVGYPAGLEQVAIKIMRSQHQRNRSPEEAHFYMHTFVEEADLLIRMEATQVKGLTRLLGCGYLAPKAQIEATYSDSEEQNLVAGVNRGIVILFSPQEIDEFSGLLEEKYKEGWLPCLILELRQPPSLLDLARSYFMLGDGLRMPVIEAIEFLKQACDLLMAAHHNNIAYKDFKLAHFYWDGKNASVIDWNSSKLLTEQESPREKLEAKARDVHGFVAGFTPLFTGRPLDGNSFIADPSPPSRVENRFKHIHGITWDERDQHIGAALQEWVNRAINGEFGDAETLKTELERSEKAEWGTLDGVDDRSMARLILQNALDLIYQAQNLVPNNHVGGAQRNEAEWHFKQAESMLLDAMSLYPPGSGSILECQRLLKAVSKEIGQGTLARVIP